MTVAVLGTGEMGAALARALARVGISLVLGSRDPSREEALAACLQTDLPRSLLRFGDHLAAVRSAEIVILAVAYEHAREMLPSCTTSWPARSWSTRRHLGTSSFR